MTPWQREPCLSSARHPRRHRPAEAVTVFAAERESRFAACASAYLRLSGGVGHAFNRGARRTRCRGVWVLYAELAETACYPRKRLSARQPTSAHRRRQQRARPRLAGVADRDQRLPLDRGRAVEAEDDDVAGAAAETHVPGGEGSVSYEPEIARRSRISSRVNTSVSLSSALRPVGVKGSHGSRHSLPSRVHGNGVRPGVARRRRRGRASAPAGPRRPRAPARRPCRGTACRAASAGAAAPSAPSARRRPPSASRAGRRRDSSRCTRPGDVGRTPPRSARRRAQRSAANGRVQKSKLNARFSSSARCRRRAPAASGSKRRPRRRATRGGRTRRRRAASAPDLVHLRAVHRGPA